MVATGILSYRQKVALLLHTAGPELQEVYYMLVTTNQLKPYSEILKVLDDYFVPQVNIPFVWHVFRQMEQQICMKAATCEETIRDQLIGKCIDQRLRRKFLEKTNATLADLQCIARAHEAVNELMKSMDKVTPQAMQVNSINQLKLHKQRKEQGTNKGMKDAQSPKAQRPGGNSPQRCYNCNRLGHFARDASCPARDKQCDKCGTHGHFSICCRQNQDDQEPHNRKAYNEEERATVQGDGHAFAVEEHQGTGEVTLLVGGDELETCNLIDYGTWNCLKQKDITWKSKKSGRKLFAYGQKKPMEVEGTFVAEIACKASGELCMNEFTVIRGSGRPLLQRSTAEKLKVLRVGSASKIQVCSMMMEGGDRDIRKEFSGILTGVGKLKN